MVAAPGYHALMTSAGAFPANLTLSADGLACVRGGRAVFAGLDARIETGEAVFLVGPNGSGKSSLLRVLSGLLPPASGRLSWHDVAVRDEPETHRARLHYVGHANALKAVTTTVEALGFWARLLGGDGSSVPDALRRVRLDDIAGEPVLYLSAGQKRRLALARLLVSRRPLWLLDEPTVGLDVESVATFEAMLREHLEAGGLAVVATHLAIDTGGRGRTLDLSAFPARDVSLAAGWAGDEIDGRPEGGA